MRVGPGASVLLLAAILPFAAARADAPAETTLAPEPTVTVDLRVRQQEAEHAEAMRRARATAAATGATEPVSSIPEIPLIARQVLHDLPALPTRYPGAVAGWRVRSVTPPDLMAQRLMARLLSAGFSSSARCPGEEWSGKHGGHRVALRVEERAVGVLLVPGSTPCTGGKPPP